MNKAQCEALEKLEELTGRTHQSLVTSISRDRVTVVLDDMVTGEIDEDGKVHWRYTRGSLCDGCQYDFTPKEMKMT